MEKLEAR